MRDIKPDEWNNGALADEISYFSDPSGKQATLYRKEGLDVVDFHILPLDEDDAERIVSCTKECEWIQYPEKLGELIQAAIEQKHIPEIAQALNTIGLNEELWLEAKADGLEEANKAKG